ncbi:MAG: ribulose-phosphate 3-epimerase [Bacilli bacterium]|nr:ribulose-phosphate 3-epimerase [Bacilli bacterium]
MVKISVSVLSKNDHETIDKLNKTDIDFFHIDVMDGKFVNKTNFSIPKIKEVHELAEKNLDVHLMVENPGNYIDQLYFPKIEYITIHYETLNNDLTLFEKIKSNGIKCGLSVKPSTDIRDIFYLLDNLDLVLVMSVEPGYGGQSFIESSFDKVRLLKEEIIKRNLKTIISIDGGINSTNAKSCIEAGCDMLVSGTYIINSDDLKVTIDSLKKV